MLALYWDRFAKHGSFYCGVIVAGSAFGMLAAATQIPAPTPAACTAFPWLLGIAFVLVYGCLFIKTWTLYKVWSRMLQYKITNFTPLHIIKILGGVLVIEVIFLVMWSIIDPPTVHQTKLSDGNLQHQCQSHSIAFWVIFLAAKGAWLIWGAILCALSRNIMKEYNESKNIAYAIYNDVVLLVIACPLIAILENQQSGIAVIEVCVIVLAFSFTLIALFFEVWFNIFSSPKDVLDDAMRHVESVTNSSASSTSPDPVTTSGGSFTLA